MLAGLPLASIAQHFCIDHDGVVRPGVTPHMNKVRMTRRRWEIVKMRLGTTACPLALGTLAAATLLAIAMTFAFVSSASAKGPQRAHKTSTYGKISVKTQRAASPKQKNVRALLSYGTASHNPRKGRKGGFADLVGDPYSGYGFYALPPEIRIAAARYRQRYGPRWWQNPVLSAMVADAIRTPCFIPANQAYRCGVFNPIDGVGTPFFAGYYR
jgi:hypothetical protein